MSNILFVSSSLSGEGSKSRQVAGELVGSLQAAFGSRVVERHLTPATMPHIDMTTFAAAGTPADKRTPEQAVAATLADTIIAEAETADVIVLAAPMYNFSVPSTLKAWLDHLARSGRTFRYTEKGPIGLLTGKRVYVVVSRGGFYGESSPAKSMEHQDSYLRAFFSFLGINDVTVIPVEGQGIGGEIAAQELAKARSAVATLVQRAA